MIMTGMSGERFCTDAPLYEQVSRQNWKEIIGWHFLLCFIGGFVMIRYSSSDLDPMFEVARAGVRTARTGKIHSHANGGPKRGRKVHWIASNS